MQRNAATVKISYFGMLVLAFEKAWLWPWIDYFNKTAGFFDIIQNHVNVVKIALIYPQLTPLE